MSEPDEKPSPASSADAPRETPETRKSGNRRKLEEIALKKKNTRYERHERKLRRRRKDESCAYCGRQDAVTTEHFIPQSSRLEIAFKKINLIPACRSCNSFKGGRWPNEKEIVWFFDYWKKQLQEVEKHLKIAEALKRNRYGKIEEKGEEHAGPVAKRRPRARAKRRHRRR